MARVTNYLNNKDILKEIHKSKTAYCSYTDPKYQDYDVIIYSLGEIEKFIKPTKTDEGAVVVVAGKIARADRLTKLAQDASLALGVKVKADAVAVDPNTIGDNEVVFRLMTWDHIPEAAPVAPKVAKGKKKLVAEPVYEDEDLITEYDMDLPEVKAPSPKFMKVNFPPFQHFVLGDDVAPLCVAKSHWQGPVDGGNFSKDHGKITNKLALMYMKLCERYATRSNWRGYTYNDEMRSTALLQLSQIGLQFDEAKSANPFAYYTAAITNSFTRVLNIEKRNQNIRDDILEMNDLTPSFTRQNSGGSDHHGTGYEE